LDADDCWLPTKLERQVPVFNDPQVVVCGTNFYVVKALELVPQHGAVVDCARVKERTLKGLYRSNYLATSTVMVRKEALVAAGGFDTRLKVMEDYDLWLRLQERGRVAVLGEALMDYFDRPGSLSKKHGLLWRNGLRLAWRYRVGYGGFLHQALHVTLRHAKNVATALLKRGPMVGGKPPPALTPQKGA
jgi:GT2 family glycosyltransferase